MPDPSTLPDDAILSMLHREVLLTEAKLHALDWELLQSDRNLRQFRSQLRQVTLHLVQAGRISSVFKPQEMVISEQICCYASAKHTLRLAQGVHIRNCRPELYSDFVQILLQIPSLRFLKRLLLILPKSGCLECAQYSGVLDKHAVVA